LQPAAEELKRPQLLIVVRRLTQALKVLLSSTEKTAYDCWAFPPPLDIPRLRSSGSIRPTPNGAGRPSETFSSGPSIRLVHFSMAVCVGTLEVESRKRGLSSELPGCSSPRGGIMWTREIVALLVASTCVSGCAGLSVRTIGTEAEKESEAKG